MKFTHKISIKIISAILICSIISIMLVSTISIYTAKSSLMKESEENLQQTALREANFYDGILSNIQVSTDYMGIIVSNNLDINKFKDTYYMNKLYKQINLIFKNGCILKILWR